MSKPVVYGRITINKEYIGSDPKALVKFAKQYQLEREECIMWLWRSLLKQMININEPK